MGMIRRAAATVCSLCFLVVVLFPSPFALSPGSAQAAPGALAAKDAKVSDWLKEPSEDDGTPGDAASVGGASAPRGTREDSPASASDRNAASRWMNFAITLIILLLLLLGLAYVLRRLRISWTGRTGEGLRLIGMLPVGTNRSVALVEVAGRRYVLGVGEAITLLDRLPDWPDEEARERAPEVRLFGAEAARSFDEEDAFGEELDRRLQRLRETSARMKEHLDRMTAPAKSTASAEGGVDDGPRSPA